MRFFRKGLLLMLSMVLLACGHQDKPSTLAMSVYKVKMTTMHNALHYIGVVQPLTENPITSPVEAVVESMPHHFGQRVAKDDVVFTLNSTELQRQYNDMLTDYLKTKDGYTIAKAKFIGTEELWQAGLLSKNNYLSEKSSLNTARISLIQATHKLTEMLEKMGKSEESPANLSLAEFDKVRLALNSKHNLIYLKAPKSGVLLYPPKMGDDRTSRIASGSPVKAGQVVALVGDLTGIRVEIDVPEVEVSELHIGLPATIRGIAFGNQALHGKLTGINAQASAASGGALPTFTAVVEVHSLTLKEQNWVKVGMSTSIELTVDSHDKLTIPIAAVKQDMGKSTVQLRNTAGKIIARHVITGAVYDDQVVVESGLNIGDEVVYTRNPYP